MNWSAKSTNFCTTLNYFQDLPVVTFTVTGSVSIYCFVSSVGIAIWITSSALGLTICVIAAGIKKA